jgi:hypothetical protein
MKQSFADYLAIDGVNWSTLRHMADSPLAYKYRLDHPKPETDAMLIGRATHTAVLEPDRFLLEYVLYPHDNRRGNKWKDFVAEHESKTALLERDYKQCLAIRDAVRAHPVAGPLLSAGESEFGIEWKDGSTGIGCKARIDHLIEPNLVDLKTTGTFGNRFPTTAAQFGYHRQLALYRQGLRADGYRIDEVLIIAVQQQPPHDVCVYRLPDELLDYAWTEVRDLLERLRECQQRDEWPGAAAEVVDLDLPLWAFPDEEPLELKIGGKTHAL